MRQQQRKENRAALTIDNAVDHFRPVSPLESADRRRGIRNVIAKALQRQQKSSIAPVRVHQILRWARQSEPEPGKRVPGKKFAGVLLACRGDIGMRHDITARDPMPSHDTVHQRSEEHTSELQSLMRISYAV